MSSDDDTSNAEPMSDSKEFETQETDAEPTSSADTLSENNTAEIEDTNTDSPEEESEKFHPRVSRRGMLLTGGVLGLLGLGSGSAAAATGSGQIGTTTTPLKTIFANEINGGVTGDTALTSLVGGDLSIDGSGNLTTGGSAGPFADEDSDNLVEPTGSLTGIDVTDVETDTLSGSLTGDTEVTSITGNGLSISSGSLTTDAASPLSVDASGISLGLGQGVEDNGGSLTASLGDGLQFDANDAIEPNLGTGLEFDTNDGSIKTADTGSASVSKLTTATSSIDALEVTEPGALNPGTAQDVNVVGGSPDHGSNGNSVSNVTVFGKTNQAQSDTATVSGGQSNSVGATGGTVSGGTSNTASGATGSTVGGGENNSAGSDYSTISGGKDNSISPSGLFTTNVIGGGDGNLINGGTSVIGGGTNNSANGGFTNVTIAGGNGHATNANNATISGGESHTVKGVHGTVGGGKGNVIDTDPNNSPQTPATFATIAGGENNKITDTGQSFSIGDHGTIIGGKDNVVDNQFGIAGGKGNTATGGIALGRDNSAGGSFIEGTQNTASIAIGVGNDASGNNDITLIGKNNTGPSGTSSNAVAIGENNEATQSDTVAIGKDCIAGVNNTVALGTKAEAKLSPDTFGPVTNSFVYSDGRDASGSDLPDGSTNAAKNEGEARFYTSGGFFIENTDTVQVTQGLAGGSGNAVNIDGDGNLVDASASSARYKTNIEPLGADTSGVLDLQPTAYEYEETGQADTGLIAEEVDEALPEIVNYDDEGRPDAVRYDRVGMFLAPEVSENRDRLETVEAAREECEETIETLEVELDAKDARLVDQADRIEHLESTIENKSVMLESVRSVVDEKEAQVDELEAKNTKLETRLSAVEAELGFGGVTADASVADD